MKLDYLKEVVSESEYGYLRKGVEWDEAVSKNKPFLMGEDHLWNQKNPGFIPFEYRVVWQPTRFPPRFIAVRKDALPLAWIFWWVFFRVGRSFRLTEIFLLELLEAWNIVPISPEYVEPTFKSVFEDLKKKRHATKT